MAAKALITLTRTVKIMAMQKLAALGPKEPGFSLDAHEIASRHFGGEDMVMPGAEDNIRDSINDVLRALRSADPPIPIPGQKKQVPIFGVAVTSYYFDVTDDETHQPAFRDKDPDTFPEESLHYLVAGAAGRQGAAGIWFPNPKRKANGEGHRSDRLFQTYFNRRARRTGGGFISTAEDAYEAVKVGILDAADAPELGKALTSRRTGARLRPEVMKELRLLGSNGQP